MKRNISFDLLKLFAIYLVIWGHCLQYFESSDFVDNVVWRTIYSFHMPLFMMISGYFASSSMSLCFVELVKKKARQLLLPFISWTLLMWLGFLMLSLSGLSLGSKGLTFEHFAELLMNNLWFLKSCFICYILCFVGVKIKQHWLPVIVSLFIPYSQVNMMYIPFLVGFLLNGKELILSSKFMRVGGVILIVMILFSDKTYWNSSLISDGFLHLPDTFMDVYVYAYRIVMGLIGAYFFMSLFYQLGVTYNLEYKAWIKRLSKYGQYTLIVYAIQNIAIENVLGRIIKLDSVNGVLYDCVITPSIALVLLIIFSFMAYLVKKCKLYIFY